jgi:MOSC domain-containing protein YiiM
VQDYTDGQGRHWRSAIAKTELAGPVFLGRLGLAGDQVGNHKHHGGSHQAVLAYPVAHYACWRAELGLAAGPGGFGENLAVAGCTEEEVCIGDTYSLGQAVLQVSQPRQPCHTLELRWERPGLMAAVFDSARGGWYLRVLQEGDIQAGQAMTLLQRPHPGWSVARVFRAFLGTDPEERRGAAALRPLSPKWKEKLAVRP